MEGVKIRNAVLADAEQLHGLFRLHGGRAASLLAQYFLGGSGQAATVKWLWVR